MRPAFLAGHFFFAFPEKPARDSFSSRPAFGFANMLLQSSFFISSVNDIFYSCSKSRRSYLPKKPRLGIIMDAISIML